MGQSRNQFCQGGRARQNIPMDAHRVPGLAGKIPGQGSTSMKTNIRLIPAVLALALLAGCDSGPKSGRGFAFPEGDLARGRKAFVDLKCYECHRVDGVAGLPSPTVASEKVVRLGGEVTALRTYGALVTAVIHPTHARTAGAPGLNAKDEVMPKFNEVMTVAQMLDIVTFLHPQYRERIPQYEAPFIP